MSFIFTGSQTEDKTTTESFEKSKPVNIYYTKVFKYELFAANLRYSFFQSTILDLLFVWTLYCRFFYNKHCKNYLALWLTSPGQFFLHEQTVNKKCLRLIAEDTSKKHKICKSMLWGGRRGDAQSESNHFVA